MVQKQGMKCLSLTWNPNYNGVDDWQLTLERKEKKEGILRKLDFKKQYLLGLCGIHHIDNQTEEWHRRQGEKPELPQYLGLTEEEYCLYLWGGKEILGEVLEEQRQCRQFRFYQLDFGPEQKPVSFAFKGIDEMHQAGYEQPPEELYRMSYEGEQSCPAEWTDEALLQVLRRIYGEYLPEGYSGRALAESDIIALQGQGKSRYYYVDTHGFAEVGFLPEKEHAAKAPEKQNERQSERQNETQNKK